MFKHCKCNDLPFNSNPKMMIYLNLMCFIGDEVFKLQAYFPGFLQRRLLWQILQ